MSALSYSYVQTERYRQVEGYGQVVSSVTTGIDDQDMDEKVVVSSVIRFRWLSRNLAYCEL